MRLQLVRAQRGTIFCGDLLNDSIRSGYGRAVGSVVALLSRFDEDVIPIHLEGSELGIVVVARSAKVGGDGGNGKLLPGANFAWSSVDLRDTGEHRALGQPIVYDVLVLEVVKADHAQKQDETAENRHQGVPYKAVLQMKPVDDAPLLTVRSITAVFEFDWQGTLSSLRRFDGRSREQGLQGAMLSVRLP